MPSVISTHAALEKHGVRTCDMLTPEVGFTVKEWQHLRVSSGMEPPNSKWSTTTVPTAVCTAGTYVRVWVYHDRGILRPWFYSHWKLSKTWVPSCGISIRLKCSSHSDTFAQSPFLDLSLPRGWISFHTPFYAACAEKLHAEKRVQQKERTLRTRFECGGALSHLDNNMESRTDQNNTRYTDDTQVF